MPLAELAAPALALAREGVEVNAPAGATSSRCSRRSSTATPEARARYCVDGRVPREGDVLRDPELADALERLAAEGAAPFYTGDIARGGLATG